MNGFFLKKFFFFKKKTDSDDFSIGTSSFDEEPSASTSKNTYPYHHHDRDSYIEEVPRRNSNEHRERSINKLTRTLGAHPLTIMDDSDRQQLAFKSPIYDTYSTTADDGDDDVLILEPTRKTRRRPDSFESDTLTSPITFATPSECIATTPPPHTTEHRDWQTLNDIDSNRDFTTTRRIRTRTTSTVREDDDHHHDSAHHTLHSRAGSSSSTSQMPQLHVSTHSTSDAVSVSSSSTSDVLLPPPDPNGPVAKSDWLVPLNEVVISIRRTAPSKPQSWTGEWNREMKDVIRDLRRL